MSERCPVCGARATVEIDFGTHTIAVEHEEPLCEPFEGMRGKSPFTCNVIARALGPREREQCGKCSRPRPAIVADPTCAEGGYCNWVGGPPS